LTPSDTRTVSLATENRWLPFQLGLPTRVTETGTVPFGPTRTRIRTARYDARGLLVSETLEPGDPDHEMTTEYERDRFGLIRFETKIARTGSRVNEVRWDSDHTYPTYFQNAAGHEKEMVYHPAFGAPIYEKSANGIDSTYTYDTFGRPRSSAQPSGTAVYFYAPYPGNWMEAQLAASDGTKRRVLYDTEGRVRRSRQLVQDEWAATDYDYDRYGHVSEVIGPRILSDSEPPPTTSYERDALGRLVAEQPADGGPPRRFLRSKLTVEIVSREGVRKRVALDAAGRKRQQVEWRPDGSPYILDYAYSAFGTVREVTDNTGLTWKAEFDAYERRTYLEDPDAGIRRFDWTPFGELWHERAADGSILRSYEYDALGRVEHEWTPEELGTTYSWDSAVDGVGFLGAVT